MWTLLSDKLPTEEEIGEKCLVYRIVNKSQESLSITIYSTYKLKYCDKEETWWMELPKPPVS